MSEQKIKPKREAVAGVANVEFKMSEEQSFKKIMPMLIDRGIDKIDFSMFNEELKISLLNEMGDEYLKKGVLENAIKAFLLTSNREKLVKVGKEYQKLGKYVDVLNTFNVVKDSRFIHAIGDQAY